jgi:hypothetical protein
MSRCSPTHAGALRTAGAFGIEGAVIFLNEAVRAGSSSTRSSPRSLATRHRVQADNGVEQAFGVFTGCLLGARGHVPDAIESVPITPVGAVDASRWPTTSTNRCR